MDPGKAQKSQAEDLTHAGNRCHHLPIAVEDSVQAAARRQHLAGATGPISRSAPVTAATRAAKRILYSPAEQALGVGRAQGVHLGGGRRWRDWDLLPRFQVEAGRRPNLCGIYARMHAA